MQYTQQLEATSFSGPVPSPKAMTEAQPDMWGPVLLSNPQCRNCGALADEHGGLCKSCQQ
jgi:hypothetical protein